MTASLPLTRAILVETRDGSKKVEGIPANAKITYGPVQPGKDSYHSGNCLRIYTTTNNQLAVFVNVVSFRDLSLRVWEQETTTESDHTLTSSPDKASDSLNSETRTRWVEAAA